MARPTSDEPSVPSRHLVRGVVASAASAVVTVLLTMRMLGETATESMLGTMFVALFGFAWALVVALVIGLPAHFAIRRWRGGGIAPYLAAGVVASLTPKGVEAVASQWQTTVVGGPSGIGAVMADSVFVMPGGLVAAAVFWTMCVRVRRPG